MLNMQTKNILHFLWQNVHSAARIWPDFFKRKKPKIKPSNIIRNNTCNYKVYSAKGVQSLR